MMQELLFLMSPTTLVAMLRDVDSLHGGEKDGRVRPAIRLALVQAVGENEARGMLAAAAVDWDEVQA